MSSELNVNSLTYAIGCRLYKLRTENDMTVSYVAKKLAVSPTTYRGYERGTRRPTLESLIRLAELFNTSLDYIMRPGNKGTAASASIITPQAEVSDKDSSDSVILLDECELPYSIRTYGASLTVVDLAITPIEDIYKAFCHACTLDITEEVLLHSFLVYLDARRNL